MTKKLRKQKKAFHTEDTDDDLSSSDEESADVLPRKHANLLEVTTTDGEFIDEESCGSDGLSPHSSPMHTSEDLLLDVSTSSPAKPIPNMDLLDLPASAAGHPSDAGIDLLQVHQHVSSANLNDANDDLLQIGGFTVQPSLI